MARAMSKVWIRHIGSTPGGFKVNEDRLINLEAVCNRFLLDLSARLTISGTPVQIINGMSDVTLDDILEEATEGEDGATKRSALTIREISFLTFRYCDEMGAIRMATLFVDGVFDLQELCNAFNLDPSGRLIVAGITVPFTDKGKSTLTARTIRELAQRNGPSKEDGLSNATAFSVQGSPAKTRGGVAVPSKFHTICDIKSPSSVVSSLGRIEERCFKPKMFKDLRAECGLPIAIAARAFAVFVNHFNSDCDFEPRVFRSARELRDRMHPFYRFEEHRRLEFTDLLKRYLEHDGIYKVVDNREAVNAKTWKRLHPDSDYASSVNRTPDIQVKATIFGIEVVLFTCEVQPEMGFNGEPLLEALIYYTGDVVESYSSSRHYCTGCPELIGELVGPNFRLGGVIYHDKAIYEPLTDFISLLPFPDDAHVSKLMRLLSGIRIALDELTTMYHSVLLPTNPPPRNSTLSWPYGLREKYPDAGAVQISNKLVYVVTTSLGQQRVVKFVREYGIDAHKQWETAGYAPEHTIQEFPGGWKMVDMECLTRVDGWHLMFDLDPKGRRRVTADYNLEQVPPWAEIQTAVWEALMTLQRLQPVMVHGDLRLNNIMYNIRTGRVCFLDFDWAGPDESVRYPLLINSGVDWPPGVAANAEIKAIHDRELLKRELGYPPQMCTAKWYYPPATKPSAQR